MSILRASILFSKASAMYSQLRYINTKENSDEYKELLCRLDSLYGRDNTRIYRNELQSFIDNHGEDIYMKSLQFSDDSFWLD